MQLAQTPQYSQRSIATPANKQLSFSERCLCSPVDKRVQQNWAIPIAILAHEFATEFGEFRRVVQQIEEFTNIRMQMSVEEAASCKLLIVIYVERLIRQSACQFPTPTELAACYVLAAKYVIDEEIGNACLEFWGTETTKQSDVILKRMGWQAGAAFTTCTKYRLEIAAVVPPN